MSAENLIQLVNPVVDDPRETPDNQTVDQKPTQLPVPQGYRILCAVPDVDKTYESGLIKADKTLEVEGILTMVLFVLKMGADCYKDQRKFPTGPWCKEGDFVLIQPHTGARLKIHGQEFRLINDDSVLAVVDDPRGIKRA